MGKQRSGPDYGLIGNGGKNRYINPEKPGINYDLIGTKAPAGSPIIMDTEGLTGNYDFGILPQRDMDEMRAVLQSNWDRTGNAFARFLGSTVLKTAQSVGYLAGLSGIGNKGELGKSWISGAADNYFAKWASEMEEELKDQFPIYKTLAYKNSSVFGNLTKPEFWTDDVVDGLAFMTSAHLQGLGVGLGLRAIGTGNKMYQILNAGKKMPKVTKSAAQMNRFGDIATRSAFMTASESMHEAKGVRDAVLHELAGEINPATGRVYTNDELLDLASRRAADAYAMNLIALAPSNYIEAGFLFSKLPSAARAGDIMLDKAGKVVKRNLKGFAKYADSYPGRVFSGVAKGGLTEGLWEENIQYSIEKLNTALETADEAGMNWMERIATKYGQAIPGLFDLDDPERGKSVLLGTIIGSPVAVGSNVREKLTRDRDVNNFIGDINKRTEDLPSLFMKSPDAEYTLTEEEGVYKKAVTYSDPMGGSDVVNQEPEIIDKDTYDKLVKDHGGTRWVQKGEPIIDKDTQQPVFNEEALAKYAQMTMLDSELQDLIDLELTSKTRQRKSAEVYQYHKLANWALAHFRAGAGDLAIEKLKMYREAEPQDVVQFGFDPDSVDDVSGLIDKRIRQVKELQEIYDSVTLGMPKPSMFDSTDRAIWRQRQEALYQLAGTITVLEEIGTDLATEKAKQLSAIKEDPALSVVNEAIARYKGVENNLQTLVQTGATEEQIEEVGEELTKARKEVLNAKKLYNESLAEEEQSKKLKTEEGQEDFDFVGDTFSPRLSKYHQTAVKAAEVQDIINRSQARFRSFMSPDGNIAFQIYKTQRKKGINNMLPLQDATSVAAYKKYEQARIKALEAQRKRRQILNNFYTFATAERIDKGEPLNQIIEDIQGLRGEYETSKDVIDTLVGLARTRLEQLDRYEEDDDLDSYIELTPEQREENYDEETRKRLDPLVDDFEKATRNNERSLLEAFIDPENTEALYTTYKPITEDSLKRDVADEYINLTDNVTVPNFNNLPFVQRLLRDLRNLKRIMNERNDGTLESSAFKNFNTTIDAKIKIAEEAEADLRRRQEEENQRLERILFDQSEVLFSAYGINADKSKEENRLIVHADMQEVWAEIVNKVPDAEKIATEAVQGGFTIAYADILGTKISDVAKEDLEFFKFLNSKANTLMDNIIKNDLDPAGYFDGLGNKPNVINRYASNPRSQIAQMVERSGDALLDTSIPGYSIPSGLQDDSPVKQYFSHLNMHELLRGVLPKKNDKGEQIPQTNIEIRLEKLARLHIRMEALYNLKKLTRSRYRIPQGLTAERDAIALNNLLNKKGQGNYNPSNEQLAALRELQRWFMLETLPAEYLDQLSESLSRFENFAYFKAPAGAGKTNVVARWLTSILKISPHQLIVGAKNLPAAKEIQKSLKPGESHVKDAASILVELDNKSITDELQLIVLDEAGALDNASLEGIADRVKELNDERGPEKLPIKVLIMGDPNQIISAANLKTVGKKPLPPIEQYVGNGIKDAYHVTRITPTTKRFRSPVEPVTDFQDMFVDQYYDLRNKRIDVRSTVSRGNTPASEALPLYGVYGTSDFDNQLVSLLKKVDKDDPKRSRVVITTYDKLEYYEKLLNEQNGNTFIDDGIVAVVDVENAQGLTIDEVYMDVPRASGQEITTYNTEVYTAASRARFFIMAKGFNLTNNHEPNIPQHARDAMEIIEDVNEGYGERVKSELALVKKYFDDPVLDEEMDMEEVDETGSTSTDSREEEPEEEATEEEEDPDANTFPPLNGTEDIQDQQSFEEGPTQEDPPINIDNLGNVDFIHNAKYPTNRHLSDIVLKDGTEMPAIKDGDTVYYVSTRRNNTPLVVMMVPFTDPQGRKIYREIGSLRPQEKLPKGLEEWFEAVKGTQLNLTDIAVVNFRPAGLGPDTYVLANKNQDLETLYIESTTRTDVGSMMVPAKGRVVASKPVKFIYDHNNPQTFKNEKELIDNVTERFIKDMWEVGYGTQGWTEEERQKELTKIRHSARVKIFSKKAIQDELRGADYDTTFNLKPGIPFLVIDNFSYPNGATSTRPFYIQLAPDKMNFKDNISGLGTSVYNEMLAPIGKGTLEQKYRNAGLIPLYEELERLYAKAGHSNITLRTELFNQLTHGLALGIEKDVIKKHKIAFKATPTMRAIAKRIDELLYDRTEQNELKDKLKPGEKLPHPSPGPAQRVHNIIAKSNLDAGDILLRTVNQNKKKKFFFTGKAIMPQNLEERRLSSVERNPAVKAFIERNVRRARIAGETEEQIEARTKRIHNMVEPGYTVAQLKEIYSHDKDFGSTTKQGFGLRNPLHMVEFNNGKLQLQNYVLDTFQGVNKSQLAVEIQPNRADTTGQQAGTSPAAADTQLPKTVQDVLAPKERTPKQATKELLDALRASYKSVTFDNIAYNDGAFVISINGTEQRIPGDINVLAGNLTTIGIDIDALKAAIQPPIKSKSSSLGDAFRTVTRKKLRGVDDEIEGDLLTLREAYDYARTMDPTITWDEFKHVNDAQMLKLTEGDEAWGLFKDNIIYLLGNPSERSIYSRVVRHEVFHKIFHMNFTEAERASILRAARAEYGLQNADEITVEERLADEFMKWKKDRSSGFAGWLKDIFQRILRALNFFNRNAALIDRIFDGIERGQFSTSRRDAIGTTRTRRMTMKDYGNDPQVYRRADNIMRRLINDHIVGLDAADNYFTFKDVELDENGAYLNLPMTFDEGLTTVYNTVPIELKEQHAYTEKLEAAIAKASKGMVILDGDKLPVKDVEDALLDSRLTERALAALSHLPSFNNYIQYLYNNKSISIDGKTFKSTQEATDDNNQSPNSDDTPYQQDDGEVRYQLTQEGLDEILGDGLQAHIKSSDEFNPEEKLSQRVKNYFMSILYKEGGKDSKRVSVVPFRNAIVNLYKTLDNVVWSNINFEKGTGTIYDNMNRTLTGAKGRAIKAKIINLMNTATQPAPLPTFRFEAVSKDEVVAIYDMTEYYVGKERKVGKSLENKSFKELIEEERGLNVIVRRPGESTQKFFEDILNEKIPGMPSGLEGMRMLTQAFRKYESAQILSETAASLGSMYRKNPKRGTFSNAKPKKGSLKRRYFEDRNKGTHSTGIASTLKHYIEVKHNLQKSKFISQRLRNMLTKTSPTVDEMQEAISMFYKNIGIVRPEEPIHVIQDVGKKFEDLKGLVESINRVGEPVVIDGVKRPLKIEDVIWATEGDHNNTSRLKSLASGLSENSIREVPTNYLRPDGVKVYMYTPSSYAVETVLKVTRASRLPLSHSMRPFLYKYNPFLTNKKSANMLNFHNGINNIDSGEYSIYKRENADQFLERVFHYGFVSSINMKSASTGTYDQFFYVPGEKSNIHSATVPIRSSKSIENLIKIALKQEMDRPNPVKNPHYRVEFYTDPKDPKKGNWTKSYIAGVENVSTEKSLEDDIKSAMEALNEKAEVALVRFVDQMQTRRKIQIRTDEMALLYDKIEQYLPEDTEITDQPPTQNVDVTSTEYKEAWVNYLRPAFRLFYQNNYMNGHFLNQLVIGDMAYFKGPSNVVKRLDIFWAPGLRGITHDSHKDVFGATTYRVGVMKDLEFSFSEDMWPEQTRIIGQEGGKYTDGQGYFLPERRQELHKMMGTGMNNRSILKPVYAGLDGFGIPRAIKYSASELTREMGEQMEDLAVLARSLRIAGADETVFGSAVKVGKPHTEIDTTVRAKVTEELLAEKPWLRVMGIEVGQEYIPFPPEAIIELRNEDWRIQLNPVHHLNSSTKNPSQLTWMTDLRKTNPERKARLDRLMADHIDNMHSKIKGAFRLREKYFKTESESRLRNLLARNLSKINGMEMQADLITAKDSEGNYVMNLNAPFISKKMTQQLASILTQQVVTIKYKGTNLVLQSAFGAENDLKFDPETGIAEVYMPNIFSDRFNKDELIKGPMAKMLGFRLPSTDIHSSITLKIKDFIDTDDNIVIAPKEIVFFHGSDYDVDKLYLLRYQMQGDKDPYSNKESYVAKVLLNDKGEEVVKHGTVLGLDKEGKPQMMKTKDEDGNETSIPLADWLKAEIGDVRNRLGFEQNKGVKVQNRPELKYLQQLQILYPIVLRNEIVYHFMEAMTAKEVRDYLFSPINTYRFSNRKDGIVKKLEDLNDRFKKDNRDMNDIMDQMDIRMDINIAEGAIGSTANFMKALGHMFDAVQDGNDPILKEGLEVTIDGGIYDSFHIWERKWDKKKKAWVRPLIKLPNGKEIEPQIWETLDSFAQLSIDNLNIQELATLNYSNYTLKAYLTGIAMGIPADTVTYLMNQPAIGKSGRDSNKARKIIQEALKLEEDAKTVFAPNAAITTAKLKKFLKDDKPLSEMTDNELAFQYNVLLAFDRMTKAGARIQSIAKFTNILKELPPNFHNVQDQMAVIDNIYETATGRYGQKRLVTENGWYKLNEDFEFPNVDILKLEHLNSSYEVLKGLKTVQEKTFKVNDPRVVRLSRRVSSMFESQAFKDELGSRTTLNTIQEKVRYEFIKYIISGLEYEQNGIKINFDTSNETPFTYERDGEPQEVGGAEAWAQRFIERVLELRQEERAKPIDQGNHFIMDLNIDSDPEFPSLKRLSLPDLGQADPSTFEQYRLDFERLGDKNGYTALQFDFLKYIALTQGLEWQASSYATILPPNLYSGLSKALDVELNRLFEDSEEITTIEEDLDDSEINDKTANTTQQDVKIDAYRENFKIQLAATFIRYMRQAPYSSEEGSLFVEQNKTFEKEADILVWDVKYRHLKGIRYPELIRNYFGNTLLWKAYQPKADEVGFVVYQQVAKRTAHNFYQYPKNIEQVPYKMKDYLDPRVRTIETRNLQSDTHSVYKPGLQPGDPIFLKSYSDNPRTSMVKAIISQVEKGSKNKEYIITVDPATRELVTPPAKEDNQFESRASSITDKALDYTLENLRKRSAIEYEKVYDPDNVWYGRFREGKVYINTAFAKADTPFHEYLHPFIAMIKEQNRPVYDKLVQELLQDRYGQEVLARIRKSPKYQEKLSQEEDIIDEAIVTLTAELAAQRIGTNTGGPLLELLKDLARLIANAIRNLVGDVRVPGNILRPKDLLTTTTMRDIADVLALTNIEFEAFDGQARDALTLPKFENGRLVYPEDKRKFYVDDAFSMLEESPVSVTKGESIRQLTTNTAAQAVRLHESGDYYIDRSGKEYDRLTQWVKERLSKRPTAEQMAELSAQSAFRYRKKDWNDPSATIEVKGIGEMTYQEFVDFKMENYDKESAKGRYMHLKVESFLATDSILKREIDIEMQRMRNEEDVDPRFSHWLDQRTFAQVLSDIGVKSSALDATVDINEEDSIITELELASPTLGIGTRADMVVEHDDGSLSIYDWKSGTGFYSDRNHVKGLLAYGEQLVDIEDSNLDRAKLEVVLRAIMIKEQLPNARFRNLNVVHLNRDSLADVHGIELSSYLGLIKKYLYENNKEAHDEFEAKGIFKSENYGAFTKHDIDLKNEDRRDHEDNIEYYSRKLQELQLAYPKADSADPSQGGRDAQIRKEMAYYSKRIQELETAPGGFPANEEEVDIGWLQRWMGNVYTVKNKFLQMYGKILLRRKAAAAAEIEQVNNEFKQKVAAVKKEYDEKKGISLRSATNSVLAGYNYRDIFGFAWTYKSNNVDKEGWYMTDVNDPELSDAQRDLLVFMKDKMHGVWDEVMTKEVPVFEGSPQPLWRIMGYKEERSSLEDDFMPRVFMGFQELWERYDGSSIEGQYKNKTGWMRPKAIADHFFSKRKAQFISDYKYVAKGKDGRINTQYIPVKFRGTNEQIAAEDHTFDIQQAFYMYMSNMITKKHMDDMIGVAEGLKVHLTMLGDEYNKSFTNSIKFLEDQVLINILDARRRNKYTTKNWTLPIGNGEYVVDPEQILLGLKTLTTWSSMWLKPVQGTANWVLITMLNHKDAVKGSIARQVGIDEDDIDYTLADYKFGEAQWLQLKKDMLLGNADNNKLYNLSKKLRFLTDNYDYKVNREDALVTKGKFWRESNLYVFHQTGEDYGNYTLLAAQLKHMKNPATGKSLWDSYDNDGKWIGGVRFKKLTSDNKTEDITELTSEEITKMKRVTQRIHGSYREEERSALELYALGKWVLQFKKYLPQLLMNLYSKKYMDQSLGAWKPVKSADGRTVETRNGETVYKWQERVSNGKLWVMLDILNNLRKFQTIGWDQMDNETRQTVIDAALTVTVITSWLVGTAGLDDEIKKDPLFVRLKRIFMEDIAQGASPVDLFRNLTNPVPVLTKLYNLSQAFTTFMFDGLLLGERTQDGRIPGGTQWRKQTPLFGTVREIEKYFGNSKAVNDARSQSVTSWLFSEEPRKK